MTQLKITLDIPKGQNKKYLIQELETHFGDILLMLQHQLGLKDPVPGYKSSYVDRSEFQNNDLNFHAYQKIALDRNTQHQSYCKNHQPTQEVQVCCKCH